MADIETICAQINGKSDAAASATVKMALGKSGVYLYGELFHTAEVQAMKGQPLFELCRLFTYGSFLGISEMSPEAQALLTPGLVRKLKQLALVDLASERRRLLYGDLMAALQIGDCRELEDLLIDTITEGLLGGRLDQQGGAVEIHDVSARDVELSAVPGLIALLDGFAERCDAAIEDLASVSRSTQSFADAEAAAAVELNMRAQASRDACLRELAAKKQHAAMAHHHRY